VRKTLNLELWHACAGPLVSLPQVEILVYYLPQRHSEEFSSIFFLAAAKQERCATEANASQFLEAGQEAIVRIRVLEQLEGNHLSSTAILSQDGSRSQASIFQHSKLAFALQKIQRHETETRENIYVTVSISLIPNFWMDTKVGVFCL
ncbi:hypothetical protein S245_066432, partial [Arachis hypogaea]